MRQFCLPALALLLLTGCGKDLIVLPQAGAQITVRGISGAGLGEERTLDPDGVEYQLVRDWLERNASGWRPHYATPPNMGIFVSAGANYLQFVGSTVIAHTKQGVYMKSVSKEDYAFLERPPDT